MTIKKQGGVFGRNPTFNNVTADQINSNGAVIAAGAGSFGDDVNINGDIILANGKGIDFSATAGTGTSELFDDYEEGTWTPTLVGFTTAGDYTLTPASGSATYVKIGKIVHVAARVTITENSSGTGVAQFGGLPFTSGGNTRGLGVLRTAGVAYPTSTLTAAVVLWTSNTTELAISCVRDNSTFVSLEVTGISSTDVVDFRITYEVA